MNDCDKLLKLCVDGMKAKNLYTPEYKKRLKWELKELQLKNDCKYFLDILESGKRGLPNKKNILIPFLIGICDEFNIEELPQFISGDVPDIDCDFPPETQQYLKNEWIPKEYGENYVCNIGSNNTLGIKSALLDIGRIYGKDRDEILQITKNLIEKDDEGNPYSFADSILHNTSLKKYLDANPEIGKAAGSLVGKTRSMGQHAAGVIISSIPLNGLVPLIKGKEGKPCSAWGEGQHSLDLSTIGLVKFDILSSESLNKLNTCVNLVKQRYGLKSVCALEGGEDWSDTSYLNDPKCLKMASEGDLKTVFQFDSDTVRNMCKEGGVDSFDDEVAYTSLNRPGCLEMNTDRLYTSRKRGQEYTIHPVLQPILSSTYGIILYQEQIIQILNTVGKIPEHYCMEIQKAISKKKTEKFLKYKEMFLVNGCKVLNEQREYLEKIWNEIEAFAKYGFNKAHAVSYTYVSAMMLYLKAYYPLEWYASVLSSLKSGDARIQEYKYDGMKRGIKFNRIDINKSKESFNIHENEIYYALSKVKSLGDSHVEKIVKGQPYKDFDDFLDRVEYSEDMIKPILGLRMFKENTAKELYVKYKKHKEIRNLDKSLKEKKEKYESLFNELLPEAFRGTINMSNVEEIEPILGSKVYKKLENAKKRYNNAINLYNKKMENLEEKEVKIDEDYLKILEDVYAGELEYYGFEWDSPLLSVGAEFTFENFEAAGYDTGPIDIKILSIEERKTKVTFYQILAEDLMGNRRKINVWSSDYKIWSDLLVAKNMIRINLKKPTNGYPTYSMNSERFKKFIRGVNDFRIMELKKEK